MCFNACFLPKALPAVLALVLAAGAGPAGADGQEPLPLAEIAALIRTQSLYGGSAGDLHGMREAAEHGGIDGLRGFLTELDRYSSYTTAEEMERMRSAASLKPAGVGMDIFEDRQKNVRCVPYPGSPAETAGIAYGDILESVDGLPANDLTLRDLAGLIRGEEGAEIEFTLRRENGGEPRSVIMKRSAADYPSVLQTRVNPPVIRIFRFGPATAKELRRCLEYLPEETGCVIDLRGNTGGSMEAGADCARFFLKKGETVLRLAGRKGETKLTAEKDGAWSDIPVVLVQDRFTASAAEIFIAALTATGRVQSRGEQSAGKARVQNLFTLKDKSILKLTTEKIMFPHSDDDWEGSGIPPSADRSAQ